MRSLLAILSITIISLNAAVTTGVTVTRHNLSSLNPTLDPALSVGLAGPRTIYASPDQTAVAPNTPIVEKEVCVYCHIPHSAQAVGAPLWNRSMPQTDYVLYSSDYLTRANYPMPAALGGKVLKEGGSISRQCLSCHDGTIAVGSIHMGGGLTPRTTPLAMQGLSDGLHMAPDNMGFIGGGSANDFNLSRHHPIGIAYDPTVTLPLFYDEAREIPLKAIPDTNGSQNSVKLFNYGGSVSYVECASCHNPHTQNKKFLRIDSGTHAQNIKNTCIACHDTTRLKFANSIHDTENTVLFTDSNVTDQYGAGTSVADMGCANCHIPHKGEGAPYLQRKIEEQTCFQGPNSTSATATTCHGSNGVKDIESTLALQYSHPITNFTMQGKHSNLDFLYGSLPVDAGEKGVQWPDYKHVECVDCHNQHAAKKGTHTLGSSNSGIAAENNLVINSPALTGASGIAILDTDWPPFWSQPNINNFKKLNTADKEYQICFKCHSTWAQNTPVNGFGITNNVMISTSFIGNGETANPNITDQSWEFNPNNRASHPVVMTVQQMYDRGPNGTTPIAGAEHYATPLASTELLAPWNANAGNQTMYCSDCHGSLNTTPGDPKGPHGSSAPFILKGANAADSYWPRTSAGTLMSTSMIDANGYIPGALCSNCHNMTFPHRDWAFKMQNKYYDCVNCHIVVPHGSPLSRMIGYSSFPAPYNHNGNSIQVKAYRYDPTYNPNDVAAPTCSGAGCHGNGDGGVYEPDPLLINTNAAGYVQ